MSRVLPAGGVATNVVTEKYGESIRAWFVSDKLQVAPVPEHFLIETWIEAMPEGVKLWRISLVVTEDIAIDDNDLATIRSGAMVGGSLTLTGDPEREQLVACGLEVE